MRWFLRVRRDRNLWSKFSFSDFSLDLIWWALCLRFTPKLWNSLTQFGHRWDLTSRSSSRVCPFFLQWLFCFGFGIRFRNPSFPFLDHKPIDWLSRFLSQNVRSSQCWYHQCKRTSDSSCWNQVCIGSVFP